MNMHAFIQALPKAETHLHLEGTVPWALARTCAVPDQDVDDPPWLAPDFRFADFIDFGEAMRPGIRQMRSTVDGYASTAAAYFATLLAQNVRYVEVSIGMGLVLISGEIAPEEVVEAVHSAAPPGLEVRVIAGVNRRYDYPLDAKETIAILETPGVDGIDLQGDERENGPHPFKVIYDAARDKGYLLRAHAGELTGPQTIIDTLDVLGVSRIEHGATAIRDDALIERLANDPGVTLDMCPTSNVKLRVAESMETHPIGPLLRRGVRVTCSTDDPAVFGVSLTGELHNLVQYQAFTARELGQLQINAFSAALLPAEAKAALIGEVEALVNRYETENA